MSEEFAPSRLSQLFNDRVLATAVAIVIVLQTIFLWVSEIGLQLQHVLPLLWSAALAALTLGSWAFLYLHFAKRSVTSTTGIILKLVTALYVVLALRENHIILTSESSTAGLGYFAFPLYATIAMGPILLLILVLQRIYSDVEHDR